MTDQNLPAEDALEAVEQKTTDEKLQKVLARAGVGSRREMERWIAAGRVTINKEKAQLGDRVTWRDRISVDGKPLDIVSPTNIERRVLIIISQKVKLLPAQTQRIAPQCLTSCRVSRVSAGLQWVV